MTRKEAILTALSDIKAIYPSKEAMFWLEYEAERYGVVTHWDKDNILDAIDYFYIKNKRLPTTEELFAVNFLPYRNIIKKFFGKTASLAIQDIYAERKLPKMTRLEVLKYACKVTQNKEVRKILKQIISEYPLSEWTVDNINDVLLQFWNEHHRLPLQRELLVANHLPAMDTFRYKHGIYFSEWYKTFMPEIYKENKEKTDRYSLKNFIKEYNRIKPYTMTEFNEKRDDKRIGSPLKIMQRNGFARWEDMLIFCKLERFTKPDSYIENEMNKIKSVVTIII